MPQRHLSEVVWNCIITTRAVLESFWTEDHTRPTPTKCWHRCGKETSVCPWEVHSPSEDCGRLYNRDLWKGGGGREGVEVALPRGFHRGSYSTHLLKMGKDPRPDWLTVAEDEYMSQRSGGRENSSTLRGWNAGLWVLLSFVFKEGTCEDSNPKLGVSTLESMSPDSQWTREAQGQPTPEAVPSEDLMSVQTISTRF